MKALKTAADLSAFLEAEAGVVRPLRLVRDLGLPDGWIGAGLIRNAVWDRMHGRDPLPPADIDVVFFDAADASTARDDALEERLRREAPDLPWSVTNQARMHAHNGHAPYRSTADALAHWVETATAVAARLTEAGRVEILAPHGLADLFALIARPTPAYRAKLDVFRARVEGKGWRQRWPRLDIRQD